MNRPAKPNPLHLRKSRRVRFAFIQPAFLNANNKPQGHNRLQRKTYILRNITFGGAPESLEGFRQQSMFGFLKIRILIE